MSEPRPSSPPEDPTWHYSASRYVTPENVLKWTGVVFVVALEALVVISIVLAMVGVYK